MTTRPTRPTATTAVVLAALEGSRGLLLAAAQAADVPLATRDRMATLAGRIGTEVDILQHEWRRPRDDQQQAQAAGGGG